MVMTIHDLTFEHHPEWFTKAQRGSFRVQARHGARTARRIFTDSAVVRDEVIAEYRVEPDRVVVVPFAVDDRFRTPPSVDTQQQVIARLGVEKPYLVTLGGAPRRRLSVALDAWRHVREREPDLTLVVVGSERPPAESDVVFAGQLDDREWAAILAAAEAFCYATAYEGFGMPALEAAAAGTVVVCAPVGALPEVLGESAQWCDGLSAADLAEALVAALDRDRAAELRQLGRTLIANGPTWADSAAIMARVYREALDD
jgi:glycosyltransferase involved in cell wall biosynthesis